MLECSGTTASFIVGSVTELRCNFRGGGGRCDPLHCNDPARRR